MGGVQRNVLGWGCGRVIKAGSCSDSFYENLIFYARFGGAFTLSVLACPRGRRSRANMYYVYMYPRLVVPDNGDVLLLKVFVPFKTMGKKRSRRGGRC